MKFRLTFLVVLFSLALSACSLAEDITPPPSFASPTSIMTLAPATQTTNPPTAPTPTKTSESIAPTVETTPSEVDSTTPLAEVSPTAQSDVLVIDGTVTVASGAAIPGGTIATLLLVNTTTGQVAQTKVTPILPDGKYEFINIPADTTTVYWVTVDYSGVTYNSVPVQFDGTLFQLEIPITVYEGTEDLSVLTITQVHLQFDFSTSGQAQVMVLHVISNPGGNSVIVPSDGSTVPFIQIPEGAASVDYQLAQSSSPLLSAANGFALLPGADMQYGIITTFTLPYTNRLVFSQPFSLPVSSATIIVPEGVKVRSDQLTDAGTQDSTGTTYHLYQGGSLASGSTLTLTISGMPGDKAGFVLDERTWLMIGVGAVGLILIGLGVFLFLRDRSLRKLEEEFEGDDREGDDEAGGEDALGDNHESIMDAIITLDDQYKTNDISKEAYEKRRDELKDRLKNLT